jgi:hypothetical protein
MQSKLVVTSMLSLAVLTLCGALLAHHGTPAYSDTVTEQKQVTVTKFAWANPHSLIFYDVKDANGKVVHWVAETAAPQALRLIGWSKISIQPGDVITVLLHAAKNGNPAGRLNKIILADGTVLNDTVYGDRTDEAPNGQR